MPSEITPESFDSRLCGHCGALLLGRFLPCPACHARPAGALNVRAASSPLLNLAVHPSQTVLPATVPARRAWHPSPRALALRYEDIEEAKLTRTLYQRLRTPVALSASILAVTSAVYLGFIHSNEANVGEPVAVSGTVKAQGGKPPLLVVQKPSANASQRAAADVAAQPAAPARAPLVTTLAATLPGTAAKPGSTAKPASTPASTLASTPTPASSATVLDRVAGAARATSTGIAATAATVAAAATATAATTIATTTALANALATTTPLRPTPTPSSFQSSPLASTSIPAMASPARSAPTVSTASTAPGTTAPAGVKPTPTPASTSTLASTSIPAMAPPAKSAPAISAASPAPKTTATTVATAAAKPTPTSPQVSSLASTPSPAPASPTRSTAAVSTASAASAAPTSRKVSLTPPADTKRASSNPATNPADTPHPDISRYLKGARANLQANNLSGAKSRIAAALAAQPGNRDALNLRATVRTREQERDALLSLARGCGYIARWTCVSRNAGEALQIDSGSKEAHRLVTRAMHETAFPIPEPTVEPQPEPQPDPRDIIAHH